MIRLRPTIGDDRRKSRKMIDNRIDVGQGDDRTTTNENGTTIVDDIGN
jgi:hypothetical protein